MRSKAAFFAEDERRVEDQTEMIRPSGGEESRSWWSKRAREHEEHG